MRQRIVLVLGSVVLGLPLVALGPQPAQAFPIGCSVGVESDFNGDGRSDAAVADPYATVEGQAEAGRVLVLYGEADGLVGEGSRGEVHQGGASVASIAEAGDRFGSSTAAADLNCDGYTDLVVGVPYEDISGNVDSGQVQIVYGSAAGLGSGKDSRQLTQINFGGSVHAGDNFGYAVDALEDVDQGGTPQPDAYAVAIGAPGWDVAGHDNAGWAGFLVPVDGGNVAFGVTQDSPDIPGAAESGDRFGAAVSLGHLTGSPNLVDAAVGVPNEDLGSTADAGAVTLVRDIYDDPTGSGLDQNSPGVPGAAEKGDQFGRSLATIRVGSTTRLAVGVSREDIGSASDAGMVQLFSSNGATLTAGTGLSQDTAGVGGVSEKGDQFGETLTFVGPGPGASTTRLVVGAPGEDTAATNAGLVQVFPVNDLAAETGYGQDSPGVPGGPQAGDRFGAAVAAVTGEDEQVLLVGVPDDVTNSVGVVDVIPVGGGTPRAWVPGAGGVPAGGASRFGASIPSGGQL